MSGNRDELRSAAGESTSSADDVEQDSTETTSAETERSFDRERLADAISGAVARRSDSSDNESTEEQSQDSTTDTDVPSASSGGFGLERAGSTSTGAGSAPQSGTTASGPSEQSGPSDSSGSSGGSSGPSSSDPDPSPDPGREESGTDPSPDPEPSERPGAGEIAEAAQTRQQTQTESNSPSVDPNEAISGGQSFTGEKGTGAEARDDRVGDAAKEFERDLVERDPDLDKDDVRIEVVEEDGERRLEPRFTNEYRREEARRDVTTRVINTTEATREDIEGVEITDDGAEVEFSDEFRREQAVDAAAERSNLNESSFNSRVTESGEVAVTLTERGSRDLRSTVDQSSGPARVQIGTGANQGPAPQNEENDVRVVSSFDTDSDDPFEQAGIEEDPGTIIVDGEERTEEYFEDAEDPSELEAAIGEDLDGDGDTAFRYESEGPLQVEAFQEGELVDPSERREDNARRRARNRAEEQLPDGFEAGEDFRVVERDGRFTATLTESGGERLAERRRERAASRAESQIATRFGLEEDDVFVDAETRDEDELLRSRQRARESETVDSVQTLDLEISRGTRERILEAQVADASEDLDRSDVQAFKDGETGEFGVRTVDQGEQFGDARIPIPGSDTTLEGVARGYADLFTENVSDPVGDVVGDAASQTQRALSFSSGATAGRGPDPGEETNFSNTSAAIARDTTELANVPRTAVAVDEAAETVGYGVSETVQGRGDEFARDLGQATGAAVDAGVSEFQENPARTSARVGASLLITGGAIGAASRASSTAGRATAVAIQPGEEVASATATRLFPRTASRLPGGRIDVEEGTLAAGRAASRRVSQRVSRVRDQIRGEQSLGGSPRQQELADRFRPGSSRGTIENENAGQVTRETDAVAGARSEPLGSPTEDIIDATVGTGRPRPESGESATRTEVETAREEPNGADELPLRDEIQRAGGARPFARGEDLPQRVPESRLEPDIQDLMRGDRAQVQLRRTRSRVETETEPEVRPGEFQSEIQSRTLRQRRELSGEVESRTDPLRSRAERRSVERERATRPEVRTSETDIGRTDVDLSPLEDEAQASSVRQDLRSGPQTNALELQEQAQQPQARVERESPGRSEVAPVSDVTVEPRQEVDARPEIRSETRVLPRTDSRAEARGRTEPRAEFRSEFGGRDPGRETESPFDARAESRLETFGRRRERESSEYDPADEVVVGTTGDDEDPTLGTGWLSETVATIATQGRRQTDAPSQDVLEDQPLGPRLTGELPTALETSGSEETQEAIEDVESLLSFGTGGSR